ncbi:hypothetical protein [Actinomadura sp. BRA 177]|uniref:hypothetical protein n=1 Tax=Actinomadura sp. BRA 177 TaxID=2745202 RepID=UPI0015955851|nr:hypothetical protein [Actinomadura sp. BRA 177]NVI93002.1 hypothetical protein [Actinomadura sp. BRA 177]
MPDAPDTPTPTAEHRAALLKAQEIVDDHTTRHGALTKAELTEAEAAWRGE